MKFSKLNPKKFFDSSEQFRSFKSLKAESRRRGEKGFSLVEILVVVALLAVVGGVVAMLIVNSNKQLQNVTAKGDFNSLVNSLQALFNNSNSCFIAFGGVVDPLTNVVSTPSPVVVPATASAATPVPITLTVGGEPINAPRPYGLSLRITKFELTGRSAAGQNNQFVVPLNLVADRTNGGPPLSHIFNLVLTLNATGQVVGCTGQYADLWIRTRTNQNNIAFMGGNVGIGTETPSNLLEVNGTVQAEKFLYKSDVRLKQNIQEIPNVLERVLKLRGVQFKWKTDSLVSLEKDQLGFIAQEVETTFPEVVQTSPETGYKSVAYGNLLAPVVEALKIQQKTIEAQTRRIEELKKDFSEHDRK